jgi:tetratricopeptide (TPR) repeat protein
MRRHLVFAAAALGLLLAASTVRAQSPSELLEKGIYAEQTAGNLDEAVALYRKAVAEAKAVEAVAAEAQYRLGQCLLKQKKNAEANAAFRKLIDAYPNQKDWVAKARKQLPEEGTLPLGPAPWKSGEAMVLDMTMGNMKLGSIVWSVEESTLNGKAVWHIKTHRYVLADSDSRGVSADDVDKNTFRPIKAVFRHTLMGNTDADYMPGKVVVTAKKGGKDLVRTDKLEKLCYDNEECAHLMRLLPLAKGYMATILIYAPFGGGKVDIPIEVVGREPVETPAGKFDCYKVHLGLVNQDFWYAADGPRYLVKLEAAAVTAELQRIEIIEPGKMKPYANDALGVSFDLPYDWYYFVSDDVEKKGVTQVFLLDSEEAGINTVTWSKVTKEESEEIQKDGAKAVRSWAEKRLAERAKALKHYKVQPDSWSPCTIGGLPGVKVQAEYLDGAKKMIDYNVFVMGRDAKAAFQSRCGDAAQFRQLRADFQKIVDSLKMK